MSNRTKEQIERMNSDELSKAYLKGEITLVELRSAKMKLQPILDLLDLEKDTKESMRGPINMDQLSRISFLEEIQNEIEDRAFSTAMLGSFGLLREMSIFQLREAGKNAHARLQAYLNEGNGAFTDILEEFAGAVSVMLKRRTEMEAMDTPELVDWLINESSLQASTAVSDDIASRRHAARVDAISKKSSSNVTPQPTSLHRTDTFA